MADRGPSTRMLRIRTTTRGLAMAAVERGVTATEVTGVMLTEVMVTGGMATEATVMVPVRLPGAHSL